MCVLRPVAKVTNATVAHYDSYPTQCDSIQYIALKTKIIETDNLSDDRQAADSKQFAAESLASPTHSPHSHELFDDI